MCLRSRPLRSGADGGGALHNLVASLSGINQQVSLLLFFWETQRQPLATNNLKDPLSKKKQKETGCCSGKLRHFLFIHPHCVLPFFFFLVPLAAETELAGLLGTARRIPLPLLGSNKRLSFFFCKCGGCVSSKMEHQSVQLEELVKFILL